jgi:hypothetical protein
VKVYKRNFTKITIFQYFGLDLQPHVADQWLWQYDPEGVYTVWGAYTLFTRTEALEEVATTTLIWHK